MSIKNSVAILNATTTAKTQRQPAGGFSGLIAMNFSFAHWGNNNGRCFLGRNPLLFACWAKGVGFPFLLKATCVNRWS